MGWTNDALVFVSLPLGGDSNCHRRYKLSSVQHARCDFAWHGLLITFHNYCRNNATVCLVTSVGLCLSAGFWKVWRRTGKGHGRHVGLGKGVFPVGCKWRDVQQEGTDKEFWALEEYEYWDDVKQTWTSNRPSKCTIESHTGLGCANVIKQILCSML